MLTLLLVTHPSQPNYVAAVGGDTFGLDDNDKHSIPANISTVVDLLDTKDISWAEYQEDMPSVGYQGSEWEEYVRKHNPLISYESVYKNSTRLDKIKRFSDFENDLSNDTLPQWAFFTPNEDNDGHDTGLAHGAKWLRGWLEPLLKNDKFMNRTLVVVTYDENDTYEKINRVYTVLLGGAIDSSKRGTTDDMYFNHYSVISSVSANWDLHSLGRWDCDANVFSIVADETGYKNTNVSSYEGLWWNESYPGPLHGKSTTEEWWPRPATELRCVSGRGVLPSVVSTWGKSRGSYNYTSVYPYDDSSVATEGGVSAVGANDRNASSDSPLSRPDNEEDGGVRRYHVASGCLALSVALAWLFAAA